jgi:hypothetical protein
MDKQLQLWIDVVENLKKNITGIVNCNNGLRLDVTDVLQALITDMCRAKEEAENGVMPCQVCGAKIVGTWQCKPCARKLRPWDTEI